MQHPIFYAMGALAAQTAAGAAPFRQKDLKFYAELFSNWVQVGGVGATYSIHNTQVMRFLGDLTRDHYTKATKRSPQPGYRLTRAGVFALATHLVTRSYLRDQSECILVWYFLKSYTSQISESMQLAGSDFSRAHQIELDQLLSRERFLQRQLQLVRHEIQRLQGRISCAFDIERDVSRLKASRSSLADCIEHVAIHYPYELNPQRSFQSTLEGLPLSVCEWEITEGSLLRAQQLFEAQLEGLKLHAKRLEGLLCL
jgi:hypothetical protein